MDLGGNFSRGFFCIGEEHRGVGFVEEVVIDAGETGTSERLITITCWPRMTSMIGIPAIGMLGSFLAGGLVTSLAPITTATSVRGSSGLISSISLQLLVGHVGLGQQHVHVARHAPGHRVDRVVDRHPSLLQLVSHLLDRMLGLGDGQTVARDDHDDVGVGELDRRILGADRGHRTLPRRCPRPPPGRPPKPAKRMLPTERFIAVAISIVRIVPEEPTKVPATISATLSRANPAAAAESPVKAFSMRDHDRHVGAADRQHDEVAEDRRGEQDRDEEGLRGIAVIDRDDRPQAASMPIRGPR